MRINCAKGVIQKPGKRQVRNEIKNNIVKVNMEMRKISDK